WSVREVKLDDEREEPLGLDGRDRLDGFPDAKRGETVRLELRLGWRRFQAPETQPQVVPERFGNTPVHPALRRNVVGQPVVEPRAACPAVALEGPHFGREGSRKCGEISWRTALVEAN